MNRRKQIVLEGSEKRCATAGGDVSYLLISDNSSLKSLLCVFISSIHLPQSAKCYFVPSLYFRNYHLISTCISKLPARQMISDIITIDIRQQTQKLMCRDQIVNYGDTIARCGEVCLCQFVTGSTTVTSLQRVSFLCHYSVLDVRLTT